jgi:mono/diheme cytochrome c family protein
MKHHVRICVVIAVSIGTCAAAWADEASDVRAGQELAEKVCSHCHVIGERPGPPFAEIANGDHVESNALLALLRSTHSDVSHPGAMPTSELSDREIEQISAYLASLRGKK